VSSEVFLGDWLVGCELLGDWLVGCELLGAFGSEELGLADKVD